MRIATINKEIKEENNIPAQNETDAGNAKLTEQPEELSKEELKKKKNREKIDKLMKKKDMRYRGPFSYRSLRIIGYIFLLLSYGSIFLNAVISIANIQSELFDNIYNVVQFLSPFALPLFLAANFCVIM